MLDIVVTNRQLCKGNFLDTCAKALQHKPFALLLREKDLPSDKYIALSSEVRALCEAHNVTFIPHTHPVTNCQRLHLPFHLASEELAQKYRLSVSVHSLDEALAAQAMGADFIVAGHIFPTGCKPGLPARGLDFLREICENVSIPVFAIGGITSKNAQSCLDVGAAGLCRMSYHMEDHHGA